MSRWKSDRWRDRLIWGGAILQAALFVFNLVASVLFLRTWARLEAAAEEMQRVAHRAGARLDAMEQERSQLWRQ